MYLLTYLLTCLLDPAYSVGPKRCCVHAMPSLFITSIYLLCVVAIVTSFSTSNSAVGTNKWIIAFLLKYVEEERESEMDPDGSLQRM